MGQHKSRESAEAARAAQAKQRKRKVALGTLGAVLFGALGGAGYFFVFQLDITPMFVGLAVFALADVGFRLFSGSKGKNSKACLICASAVTVAVLFLSAHVCMFYELYHAFLKQGMTFGETLMAYPELLAIKDISDAVNENLLYAYLFALVGAVWEFVRLHKGKKE